MSRGDGASASAGAPSAVASTAAHGTSALARIAPISAADEARRPSALPLGSPTDPHHLHEERTMSTNARQWRIFYLYTLWSVLAMIIVIPVLALWVIGPSALEELREHPFGALLLLVQTVLASESARAALARWASAPTDEGRGRWDLPRAGILSGGAARLLLAAVPTPLIGLTVLLGSGSRQLLVLSAVVLAVAVLLRYPWPWSAAVALAGLVLIPAGLLPALALPLIVVTFAVVLTVRMSIWLGAVVRELDHAREAQGQLAVAEERLRFARDLHDVTGRDLSVIAVKAEVVAQLAERGDPRAAEHGRDVAQIARSSLAEIRGLVRGYREADLATELRGTASLLRSAHVDVAIEGSADEIPLRHRSAAAWVLREGGTNILRHAAPSAVSIALGPEGITMTNDGVRLEADGAEGADEDTAPGVPAPYDSTPVREGSGLTGMRERLGAGAHLETRREGDRFTLSIRFDPAGGPA
ncbi:histidine kinase [Brachybacterium sp. JHP9]|uniref:Histidine kinase n=1 Tax=Brachybacterium equifaecis TaxID=2910770 RepID=A0ABT0R1R4_9MICO|nr:histidine kinase [Brachybacterium equifaecis]